MVVTVWNDNPQAHKWIGHVPPPIPVHVLPSQNGVRNDSPVLPRGCGRVESQVHRSRTLPERREKIFHAMLFHTDQVKVPAAIFDRFSFLHGAVEDCTQRASPGGSARHFCEEVSSMSMPQASISIFAPPREETASTKINVSGETERTASAISLTGFCRPVDVSLWTMVRASNSTFLNGIRYPVG